MTEQQAIDFIKAYEPVESPYSNISDVGYNARRCATMAKKQYGANAELVKWLYIMQHLPKHEKEGNNETNKGCAR